MQFLFVSVIYYPTHWWLQARACPVIAQVSYQWLPYYHFVALAGWANE